MSGRSLVALINDTQIGVLQEVDGLWSFQYEQTWLSHPQRYALSPHLPLTPQALLDGASQRPVQWYFDNLLPEEGQRALLAADAELESADAFGLLAWYGSESAGSLTLLTPQAEVQHKGSLRLLSDEALSARIKQLPKAPLTHAAVKRMSLAGAQHKLAVVVQNGQLFEPEGATPSTHILKPDHPDEDYRHSVVNEWFVMRLAKRLGLNVPQVERRYVPSPIYLVSRFDRVIRQQACERRHVIDACQLLGLDRSFKYSQGSVARLAELAQACRSPAVARARLFEWLVFNVLVGNSDAHLKNLSFMVSHEGIELAPFYDLLSVASYDTPAFDKPGWPSKTQLAWSILGVQQFSGIDRECMLHAGAAMGLAKSTASRVMDSLRTRIAQECANLLAEVEVANAELVQERPVLAATLAGEARCLRTIQYTIIQPMVQQLR